MATCYFGDTRILDNFYCCNCCKTLWRRASDTCLKCEYHVSPLISPSLNHLFLDLSSSDSLLSSPALLPPPPILPTRPHLLVLALLWAELLQHPAVPYCWEVLPQGALSWHGHGTASGCPVACPGATTADAPVHGIVCAGLADVAADCLASDLLDNDSVAVRLVQRL